MATKIISKTLLYEVLVDFLPKSQKGYTKTKAYAGMCDALLDYIQSNEVSRDDKRQILEHFKEIFDDMCKKVPPPEQPDPERAWISRNH